MAENNNRQLDKQFDPIIELGTTGLKQCSGTIVEEFMLRLRGQNGIKVYAEMRKNSSVIGTIRFLIKTLIRQAKWSIEPAGQSPAAIDVAHFIDECLADMSHSLEDFISECLSFLDYGWAYFEICYKLRKGKTEDSTTNSKYDDGKIGWRKIPIRAQTTLDRWLFSEDGGLSGMVQVDYYTGKHVDIPIEKALLFRTESDKNNPEGESIFRNAVTDYWSLKKISEIEAIGIERDMCGLITMEVPFIMLDPNADATTKAVKSSLEKMLSEIKNDERAFAMIPAELDTKGMPTGYKLKLLASGGAKQNSTIEVKKQYKLSILQSVLAQFVELGMQGVGSFSLASSQTNIFSLALNTFMDIIATTFTKFAIQRLCELNQFPNELCPSLVHGDIESPSLEGLGAYVVNMANAGVLPVGDKGLTRRLLEVAGLPVPEEFEEV